MREVKLLDEVGGVDETYPNYYPKHQATAKERLVYNPKKHWPQRNYFMKQRLLFEGKVRSKEGEFEGASMIVPTDAALEQWIEKSKAMGAAAN